MRRIAGWVFGVGLPLLLGDLFLRDTDLVSGTAAPLATLVALAGVYWIATTARVRPWLPSLRFRREGRAYTLVIDPPSRSWRNKRDLKTRAERVASELQHVLADHRRTDPSRKTWFDRPDWSKLSDDEKNRAFNEQTQASVDHSLELMNRYAIEYSAEALYLCEEFIKRGLAQPGDRSRFEHPTNPLGVEEVARKLGLWGKQL